VANIGVYGMGVMGSNLALNFADHGFSVAVCNVTPDLTDKVLREHPHEQIKGYYDLKAFVGALERPRRVIMMILAGKPVDDVIDELLTVMEPGDMILDTGNSYFEDTVRRAAYVESKGLFYFGVGVSGGERGARFGPAVMPGGDADAYAYVAPFFEAIAARAADGVPCCAYMGTDGAGHYVKMVHNGIEYADMQLIAEAYLLLKYASGCDNAQMSDIFEEWNTGELRSFLVGITSKILREPDDLGSGMLIDRIIDRAGQKGTGRWTSIEALREGVDLSLITAACNARVLSNCTAERAAAAAGFGTEPRADVPANFVETVRRSLYIGKIIAYTQGFALYRAAARTHGWHLDYAGIARIFRSGCIIQAELLGHIAAAYEKDPELPLLLLDEFFLTRIRSYLPDLRSTGAYAAVHGIPVPALLSAVSYLDMLCAPQMGANLIQGQRDYFGAHTYERTDRPGSFHHQWDHVIQSY